MQERRYESLSNRLVTINDYLGHLRKRRNWYQEINGLAPKPLQEDIKNLEKSRKNLKEKLSRIPLLITMDKCMI